MRENSINYSTKYDEAQTSRKIPPLTGILHVVSTPIGNLEDITLRALRILREVDLIAAEDTRRTRKLLTHYDIHTPLTSFFEGNQIRKTQLLLEKLSQGQNIALVSDAGTPGISDPGYPVIKACIDAGVQIVPIPGPSACIVAAVISGFPLHNFVFEGFLSHKSGKRRKQLESLRDEKRTLIFYESPHRLVKFLRDALEILSDREIVIAYELTKIFEGIYRGKISEALQKFQQEQPRGEFTIVIRGSET
ncbi:MAG: 16S rRNA (cytidine(1402)-2'-O)-methyltransferase [Candidatus Poribacteria bacterium]